MMVLTFRAVLIPARGITTLQGQHGQKCSDRACPCQAHAQGVVARPCQDHAQARATCPCESLTLAPLMSYATHVEMRMIIIIRVT